MEIHLDNYLPEYPSFVSGIRRAPGIAAIRLRPLKQKRH